MESQIGLYKTELIEPRKPWKGLADVELATAEWVDWFNNQHLHTEIGDIPPHEHETNLRSTPAPTGGWSQRIDGSRLRLEVVKEGVGHPRTPEGGLNIPVLAFPVFADLVDVREVLDPAAPGVTQVVE